ncbi:MAG: hypothetical protein NC308_07390 [Clostridium sp.]|nr:hypothetical protein [Bacteroides sp.]MCM1198696.1 hypothetical protein [Clostridium sp.]
MKNVIRTYTIVASCLLLASELPSVAKERGGEPFCKTSGYKGSVSLNDLFSVYGL